MAKNKLSDLIPSFFDNGLFWTLLLVLFLRAFVVEPFRIPSGSMIPTLLVGDFLFVAKGSYDIGIPFTNKKLIHVSDPKNGDVAVFEYPNHEKDEQRQGQYYIKRIIGVPGDRVAMKSGFLYINGQRLDQVPYSKDGPKPGEIPGFRVLNAHDVYFETLPGQRKPHYIQRNREFAEVIPSFVKQYQESNVEKCFEVASSLRISSPYVRPLAMNEICEFTVPENQFFTMGDNREDSADGREWGFVSRELLKGRALFIWLSWNPGEPDSAPSKLPLSSFFRWSRFGLGIN